MKMPGRPALIGKDEMFTFSHLRVLIAASAEA